MSPLINIHITYKNSKKHTLNSKFLKNSQKYQHRPCTKQHGSWSIDPTAAVPCSNGTSSVTRVSTIVEILKIWSKIFSNKNAITCILSHEFSFFCTILAFFTFFPTFLLKKSIISKNALVTQGTSSQRPHRRSKLSLAAILPLPLYCTTAVKVAGLSFLWPGSLCTI